MSLIAHLRLPYRPGAFRQETENPEPRNGNPKPSTENGSPRGLKPFDAQRETWSNHAVLATRRYVLGALAFACGGGWRRPQPWPGYWSWDAAATAPSRKRSPSPVRNRLPGR